MLLELKEAQEKLIAAINSDPEMVIAKAISIRPSAADIAAETRKASGPIAGVAAATVMYALEAKTAAESAANIISFAYSI